MYIYVYICVCAYTYIYTYIYTDLVVLLNIDLPKICSKLLNLYRHEGGCRSEASRKYEKNRGARSGAATRKKNHHVAPRLVKFLHT